MSARFKTKENGKDFGFFLGVYNTPSNPLPANVTTFRAQVFLSAVFKNREVLPLVDGFEWTIKRDEKELVENGYHDSGQWEVVSSAYLKDLYCRDGNNMVTIRCTIENLILEGPRRYLKPNTGRWLVTYML